MREKKRSKARQETPTTRLSRTHLIAEWIVLAGIYGALLTPLVYTRAIMFPFVYPKALFFQAVVDVAFPVWAGLALRDRRYRPQPSALLWSMLAWLLAMTAATCFAENPWRSLFSYPERMTGLLSQAHMVAWFVMASGMLKAAHRWRKLLQVHLAVAFVCAATAALQLVYPAILGAAVVAQGERLMSLLGNPIYLGAYEAFGVFFAAVLFREARQRQRVLYTVAAIAAIGAVLLAGSRGPLLGLIVGIVTAILVLGAMGQHRRLAKAAVIAMLAISAGYATILVFLIDRPSLQPFWAAHANLQHLFDFTIDPSRLGIWKAAWYGFLNRPALGWGPGGYELAFDTVYRPSFLFLALEDKAHSIPVGVLCETGAIGIIAFLGVWTSFFVVTLRTIRQGRLTPLEGAALLGAGAGYFVQSLFAPDATATDLTITVVFAVVASAGATMEPMAAGASVWPKRRLMLTVALVSVPALLLLLFGSLLPFVASRDARRAVDAVREGDSVATVELLESARSYPSPYLDDRLTAATSITLGLAQANLLATWPRQKALIDTTLALTEDYLRRNPTHARLRAYIADTLLAVGRVTDQAKMNARAESLHLQSIGESPSRQSHRFAYAAFLTRLGRLQEAEQQYRTALAADPRMGQSRWMLGTFLWGQLKQADEGTRLMADALEGEEFNRYWPSSPLEWLQLVQALQRQQRTSGLRMVAALLGRARVLPEGPLAATACVEIAKLMEDAGLLVERDLFLRLGVERNAALAATAGPVLSGTARLRAPASPSSTPAL